MEVSYLRSCRCAIASSHLDNLLKEAVAILQIVPLSCEAAQPAGELLYLFLQLLCLSLVEVWA